MHRFFPPLLMLAGFAACLAGCSEPEKTDPVEVRRFENAVVLFEALADSRYDAVIDCAKTLQIQDRNNLFLKRIERVSAHNQCTGRVAEALDKGDYARAESLINEHIAQYGSADRIPETKERLRELKMIRSLIEKARTEYLPAPMAETLNHIKRVKLEYPRYSDVLQRLQVRQMSALRKARFDHDMRILADCKMDNLDFSPAERYPNWMIQAAEISLLDGKSASSVPDFAQILREHDSLKNPLVTH